MAKYTGKFPNVHVGDRNYLRKGDKGEEVKKLQSFLKWAINAPIKPGGTYGEKTTQAVKDFQQKVGLPVDGTFGEASLKKAKEYEIKPGVYQGKLPSLLVKKTAKQVINDALGWAAWISKDNSFHYGHGRAAHHNGCYFCGTNTLSGARAKKGVKQYKKTYCCNPFVNAAFAHGGLDSETLKLCRNGSSLDYHKGRGYDTSSKFKKVGHPKKSNLKPGDVLCRSTHVAMYYGNGKIVQARGEDDNKVGSKKWNRSIGITTLTDKNYKNFPRVYRYRGKVNRKVTIRHGEYGDRVGLLQDFLAWYFGKEITSRYKCFDDETLKYVKKFQRKNGLKATGRVGKDTLKKMKTVKK